MNPELLLNSAADLRRLADRLEALASELAGWAGPAGPEKAATLEEVRAALGEKSADGYTAEIRALLAKHGAPKLSQIDPARYAALLADAEALK